MDFALAFFMLFFLHVFSGVRENRGIFSRVGSLVAGRVKTRFPLGGKIALLCILFLGGLTFFFFIFLPRCRPLGVFIIFFIFSSPVREFIFFRFFLDFFVIKIQ